MQELWYTRHPERLTATGIAADLGWLDDEFTPEGIAVRDLGQTPGADGHRHTPRTLFRESGNALALGARSRGAATRLVGLTWAEERQAIVTRPYVTIREPEDLRGRRIGLPLRTGPRFGVRRANGAVDVRRASALRGFQGALWAGGLTLNDTHPIDVPIPAVTPRRPSGIARTPAAAVRRSSADIRSPAADFRSSAADIRSSAAGEARGPAAGDVWGPATSEFRSPAGEVRGPAATGAWSSAVAGRPAAHAARQWAAEFEALARGEIDAVYVKGAPAVEAARRYGLHVAIDLDGHPDRRVRLNDGTLRPITVDKLLLDVRPDVVARFLRVLLDAAEWATAHPAHALALPGEPPTTRDRFPTSHDRPPTSHDRFPTHDRSAVPPASHELPDLSVDLSAERLALLADQGRFLRAHGFLDAAVDVDAWADHSALADAQARRRSYQEQTV
ncbi:hypothetical protein [Sphaerisporangium corydalis]|uniref:SsuA/THI5-like domain-containing protein n=1 Tax=Sphaerisporangium corydalis TaxID=1441875 RepID=A0ABV9EPX9_9ACTN|nr:hypothetical protein [Sphaerisporangium corydalis]